MSRNDDHTAIAMMTGDTIQRRLRSLDRLFLGVQNTIGNLMRSDFLDERLTDAGAGDRDGIVVGIGTTARQRRIADTSRHLVGNATGGGAGSDVAGRVTGDSADGAMLLPLIAVGLRSRKDS